MGLTPMRVRGKHKKKRAAGDDAVSPASSRASPAASSTSSLSTSTPTLSRRPRKSPRLCTLNGRDESALPATTTTNNPPSSRRRPRQRLALLEDRLPLELLERIFVLSQNVNLALCSRRLGRLLSGRATLLEMVLAAFAPTWDRCFGQRVDQIVSADRDNPPGDPAFQTAVLACDWATLPLLLDAQQLWLRRRRETPLRACMALELAGFVQAAWTLNERARAPRDPLARDRDRDCDIDDSVRAADRQGGDAPLHSWMRDNAVFGVGSPRPTHRHVHPRTRIPERLLLAGSNNGSSLATNRARLRATVETLFWLVAGGARLQEADSWEVTHEGFGYVMALVEAESAAAPPPPPPPPLPSAGTPEAEADQRETAPAGSALGGPSYSTDRLAVALLELFNCLDVFRTQWPRGVLTAACDALLARSRRGGRAFAATETVAYVRRMGQPLWA
ncbi:hypothetical protein SPI_04040 [Niveomyces insectorum RCEF 264]|uniref:Uncharacterized protein n=1 Tax=Niveomyces insectorum RCEF 264 TaxID=1081102 RepID=A0A167VDQ8_9HYPO|nr:hypothetical protein SPI_04040 [Niveomyces insectorum RCEF 264]